MSVDTDLAIILIALLTLVADAVLALAVGRAAKKRGRSRGLSTILSLVFNPLFVWIVVVLMRHQAKPELRAMAAS
jgi:hypothetical protein